jgi:uncharacterized protein YbjT (DUF2867 family)
MNDSSIFRDKGNLILVVGATGDLGGAITRILLSKGKSVRVLVRPQSNYQPLIDAGAQAVMGDMKNRSSLEPACKGVEVLITTATSAKRGGDDNPKTVDLEGNRNLIDAAKAGGVKQFIFVSANIAHPNSPIPLMQAKGVSEEYLRVSGVSYTIIAPDAFMEVWVALVVGIPAASGKPVTFVGTGNRKHSFISAVDVANFIIASINNPAAMNQKLVIGGPEPLSFRDTVAVFERVLGHDIPVQSIPIGQPVPCFLDAMAQFLGGFDSYDSPIDMSGLSRTFGIRLTSLEEFAKGFMTSAKR